MTVRLISSIDVVSRTTAQISGLTIKRRFIRLRAEDRVVRSELVPERPIINVYTHGRR